MRHCTALSCVSVTSEAEESIDEEGESTVDEEFILFCLFLDWQLSILTVYGILAFDIVLVCFFYKR
jgi:hypothetical protein